MPDTAEEIKTNSNVTFFSGTFHTDEQVLDNQLELIDSSSVLTQDVI